MITKATHLKTIWIAGIAIFSMFFGAGNVVFPLKVGILSGEKIPYALMGLLLTAIGGPLLGLVCATLYKGDCMSYFSRPGKVLGMVFIGASLFLLGPFAVIPRCFVVAHSAFSSVFPGLSILHFSILFGVGALFCCFKPSYLLNILGKFFSPLLIICLFWIILEGIRTGTGLQKADFTPSEAFLFGFEEGFDTMDLIAAIFFSSSIWSLLFMQRQESSDHEIAKTAIFSGLLGGSFLGVIYVGLAFAAAFHAPELASAPYEKLMPSLSYLVLGPLWGNVANAAIVLACFTTVVSLTQTISAQTSKIFLPEKLSYTQGILGITVISIFFANLGFAAISWLIHHAIAVCYPAIIVLTICNLIHKLNGFMMIKRPIYGTLAITTLFKMV